MRKWPFFLSFVAVALVGCGGSGSNNVVAGGGGGGGGGVPGRGSFGVNFPLNIKHSALLDTYLLPGLGRAPGAYDQAQIGHIDYTDTQGFSTRLQNPLQAILEINLDNFNAQSRHIVADIPAPEGGSAQSRLFTDLQIDVQQIVTNDGAGNQTTMFPATEPEDITNVSIGALPGRTTAVQIFLNTGMFPPDPTNPGVFDFDQAQFNAVNANPTTGNLTGFLSDYLMFDITNVANPPQMVNTPGPASKLFVSGDFYALGGPTPAAGQTSPFEVITDSGTFPGVYHPADPRTGLKTYELQQPNPVFGNPGTITALFGPYYDFTERISAAQSPLMLAFPRSSDGSKQEVIVFTRLSGKVTNMWFGTINYLSAGGPSFTIFPIADLQPASANNPIHGTLSALVDARGLTVSTSASNWWQLVRGASWTVTSGSGLPVNSGQMVVYRV